LSADGNTAVVGGTLDNGEIGATGFFLGLASQADRLGCGRIAVADIGRGTNQDGLGCCAAQAMSGAGQFPPPSFVAGGGGTCFDSGRHGVAASSVLASSVRSGPSQVPSVFVGQHDRDHANSNDRVGRIGGQVFQVPVEVIALEFKRSLLVVAHRQESIVQVRTVILIALLAIVRKLMILDLASTESSQLFALAAAQTVR
jgi:hypothetical protein